VVVCSNRPTTTIRPKRTYRESNPVHPVNAAFVLACHVSRERQGFSPKGALHAVTIAHRRRVLPNAFALGGRTVTVATCDPQPEGFGRELMEASGIEPAI